MATEQLHVPIDAWLSGKISIGPRRDPQIMTDFQMQVMDVRGGSCLHRRSWWFLLCDCLSEPPCLSTTVHYGSATDSIFQAAGPPSTAGTLSVPGLALTHPESVCFLPEAMGSTGERIWTT